MGWLDSETRKELCLFVLTYIQALNNVVTEQNMIDTVRIAQIKKREITTSGKSVKLAFFSKKVIVKRGQIPKNEYRKRKL